MTRTHVTQPVWAWHCDVCKRVDFRMVFTQSALPSADEMRAEGWFIATVWGDKCPDCQPHDSRPA